MQFSVMWKRTLGMYDIYYHILRILKSVNLFRTRIRFPPAASLLYQYAHPMNARQLFYKIKQSSNPGQATYLYYMI